MRPKQLRTPLIMLFATVALIGCLTPIHGPKYIESDTFDFKAILQSPPANDSEQTRAELDEILSIQASRTPEQVARVKTASPPTPNLFANVIGPKFDVNAYPATCTLLRQVEVDTGSIVDRAKEYWARPRPANLNPAVKYEVRLPFSSTSYPSYDTAVAFAWAVVMGELFPEKKGELLARADEIGMDRIVAGVHYRSDVMAGKKLGQSIAARIIKSTLFQADLAAAKKEMLIHN